MKKRVVLRRDGDAWECLQCIFRIHDLPGAIQHAEEQHGIAEGIVSAEGICEEITDG